MLLFWLSTLISELANACVNKADPSGSALISQVRLEEMLYHLIRLMTAQRAPTALHSQTPA